MKGFMWEFSWRRMASYVEDFSKASRSIWWRREYVAVITQSLRTHGRRINRIREKWLQPRFWLLSARSAGKKYVVEQTGRQSPETRLDEGRQVYVPSRRRIAPGGTRQNACRFPRLPS